MKEVEQKAELFRKHLKNPKIKEIRGEGLMLSLEFENEELAQKVVDESLEKGLILFYFLFTKTAIRITPPITITEQEIIEGCEVLKGILEA